MAGDSPAGDGDTQPGRLRTESYFCSPGLSLGRLESHDQDAADKLGPGHGVGSQSQDSLTSQRTVSLSLFFHGLKFITEYRVPLILLKAA